MITLTYKTVSNGMFVHTMQRLTGLKMNPQKAYALKKMVDFIERQQKIIEKEYETDVKSKMHKNEIIKEEGKPDQAKPLTEEQMKENDAIFTAFGEKSFQIDRPKLGAEFFHGVDVSAAELTCLEELVNLEEPTQQISNVTSLKA